MIIYALHPVLDTDSPKSGKENLIWRIIMPGILCLMSLKAVILYIDLGLFIKSNKELTTKMNKS